MFEIELSTKKNKKSSNIKVESSQTEGEVALNKLLLNQQDDILKKNYDTSHQKIRLVWTKKGKLHELIDILYKKKFIKTKKELFTLFEKPFPALKIKWNLEKKYHLAYLLYRMYQEKHIMVIGGKGFYKYAEEHFTDFNEIPFKNNSLKNIKLKIIKRIDDYSFICEEIDDIIAKYSNL